VPTITLQDNSSQLEVEGRPGDADSHGRHGDQHCPGIGPRLTLPDGSLYDDGANKAVFVQCADGCFALAYTGLAILGRQRTDIWLTDVLSNAEGRLSPPGAWTVYAAATAIQQEATRALKSLPAQATTRGITFVLAGYYNDMQPFVGVVSNSEDVQGNEFPQFRNEFVCESMARMPGRRFRRTTLLDHGARRALDGTIDRRMKKVKKTTLRQSGELVEDGLVSLIRAASRHERFGVFIGRDCMSPRLSTAAGPFPGQLRDHAGTGVVYFPGRYHDHRGGTVHYYPHVVYPGFSMRNIVFGPAEEVDGLPPSRV